MASQKNTETIATTSEEERHQEFINKCNEYGEKISEEFCVVDNFSQEYYNEDNSQVLMLFQEHIDDGIELSKKIRDVLKTQKLICDEYVKEILSYEGDVEKLVSSIVRRAELKYLSSLGAKLCNAGNVCIVTGSYEDYLKAKENSNEAAQKFMEEIEWATNTAKQVFRVWDEENERGLWGEGAYNYMVNELITKREKLYRPLFEDFEEWWLDKEKYVVFKGPEEGTVLVQNVHIVYERKGNGFQSFIKSRDSIVIPREYYEIPMAFYKALQLFLENRGDPKNIECEDTEEVIHLKRNGAGDYEEIQDPRAAAEEQQPKKKPRRRGGKKHKKKK